MSVVAPILGGGQGIFFCNCIGFQLRVSISHQAFCGVLDCKDIAPNDVNGARSFYAFCLAVLCAVVHAPPIHRVYMKYVAPPVLIRPFSLTHLSAYHFQQSPSLLSALAPIGHRSL